MYLISYDLPELVHTPKVKVGKMSGVFHRLQVRCEISDVPVSNLLRTFTAIPHHLLPPLSLKSLIWHCDISDPVLQGGDQIFEGLKESFIPSRRLSLKITLSSSVTYKHEKGVAIELLHLEDRLDSDLCILLIVFVHHS